MAEDRDGARIAKYDLTDADLDLIAAVPLGDNPEARIVLLKAHPDALVEPQQQLAKSDGGDVNTPTTTTGQAAGGSPTEDTVVLTKAEFAQMTQYVDALEQELNSSGGDDDAAFGADDLAKCAPGSNRRSAKVDLDDDDFELDDEDDPDDADITRMPPKMSKSADLQALIKANPALGSVIKSFEDRTAEAERVAKMALAAAYEQEERANDVTIRKHAEALTALDRADEMALVLKTLHTELSPDSFEFMENKLVEWAERAESAEESLTKSIGFAGTGRGSHPGSLDDIAHQVAATFGPEAITKTGAPDPRALDQFLNSPEGAEQYLAQKNARRGLS